MELAGSLAAGQAKGLEPAPPRGRSGQATESKRQPHITVIQQEAEGQAAAEAGRGWGKLDLPTLRFPL